MALFSPFLVVEGVFLAANLLKVLHGGYVPLLIASGLILVMATCMRGTRALRAIESREPRLAGRIAGIRGYGLMLGIELANPAPQLVIKGLEHGVLMNLTAEKVVRLAPPLDIPRELFEQGLEKVVDTLASL